MGNSSSVKKVEPNYPYIHEPEGCLINGNCHIKSAPKYPPECYANLAAWLGSGNLVIDGDLSVKGRIFSDDTRKIQDILKTIEEWKEILDERVKGLEEQIQSIDKQTHV